MSDTRRGRAARAHLGRGLSILMIGSALFVAGVPSAVADDGSPSSPTSSAPSDGATSGGTTSDGSTRGDDLDQQNDRSLKQQQTQMKQDRAQAAVASGYMSASFVWRAVADRNRNHRVDAGDTVPYVATLANKYNGSATLRGFHVTSDRAAMRCQRAALAPGQSMTCTGTATVGDADARSARLSNALHVTSAVGGNVRNRDVRATDVPVSDCSYNAPGSSNVAAGTFFNRPYGTTSQKNNIRYMVIRAVNATPQCEKIIMSLYSINDPKLVDALIAAYRRGVDVKVMANSHMLRGASASAPFKRLVRTIRSSTLNTSWARVCSGSCRGRAGNHHYKMYLFSRAGNTRDVTMMGSHNSTLKAVNGQWNHIDVYNNAATWQKYYQMFGEVAQDRAQAHPYREYTTGAVNTWFFPRPGTSAANDPMMRTLSGIQCGGVAAGYGRNGRTLIRIGMYAWHDSRGVWLAKRVRALWNAGCDVAVEYAVIGNNVKQILYSPAGRGRIPMRQVSTSSRNGTIINYTHEKYVTVSGHQYSYRNMEFTATGTTNWANLGFSSDDTTQVWHDRERARRYRADFYSIWRGPKAHVPSPTSRIPGTVGKGAVTFGKGKYRNLEAN